MNMDTTYWGRHFGLMIIKDTFRNKILWHRFVRDESVSGYLDGIEWLRANRVQHIRYRLRRHARFVSGIENIPVTDVPVPYDTDCPKTSGRQSRIWKRPLNCWPSHNHSAGYRKRNSGRRSRHGMKNGGTSSRRKASVQMVECISLTRVQGPHTVLSGSICLTSGLLNTIRNSVYRIQMQQ